MHTQTLVCIGSKRPIVSRFVKDDRPPPIQVRSDIDRDTVDVFRLAWSVNEISYYRHRQTLPRPVWQAWIQALWLRSFPSMRF